MAATLRSRGSTPRKDWLGPTLRLGAVTALLVTAGGLAIPAHRGLFGALALLVALAAWLLPERRAAAAVPVRAAARAARGEG